MNRLLVQTSLGEVVEEFSSPVIPGFEAQRVSNLSTARAVGVQWMCVGPCVAKRED